MNNKITCKNKKRKCPQDIFMYIYQKRREREQGEQENESKEEENWKNEKSIFNISYNLF